MANIRAWIKNLSWKHLCVALSALSACSLLALCRPSLLALMAARGARCTRNKEPYSRGAEAWPMRKLLALSAAPRVPAAERGDAVVVTTGAMNPMHLGHVQMLHQARARLESAGFRVIGGWVSPSHDKYVQAKASDLRTPGFSDRFRLEVARLTTADDSFVDVGHWETSVGDFRDYPEVAAELEKFLQSELPQRVTVFYVCGTDHFRKCHLSSGLGSIGVVVVPRGDNEPSERPHENPSKNVFVAEKATGHIGNLSSTEIREAMPTARQDGSLQGRLPPSVVQFLTAPTPEQRAAFADDFVKVGV